MSMSIAWITLEHILNYISSYGGKQYKEKVGCLISVPFCILIPCCRGQLGVFVYVVFSMGGMLGLTKSVYFFLVMISVRLLRLNEFWFDWPVMENEKPQEAGPVFGNIAGSDKSHSGGI